MELIVNESLLTSVGIKLFCLVCTTGILYVETWTRKQILRFFDRLGELILVLHHTFYFKTGTLYYLFLLFVFWFSNLDLETYNVCKTFACVSCVQPFKGTWFGHSVLNIIIFSYLLVGVLIIISLSSDHNYTHKESVHF